jgi:C-terminal processing protease CtpA/Prc
VELVVEYKVGGAVVPGSGVFTVRVARPLGGQPDLGLTVNEELRISEVRRGSLAYRTGSLAPGDRLLAIDAQRLDPGDLRQAAQLLHRPGSSVVALTVRKPDLTEPETRYQKLHKVATSLVPRVVCIKWGTRSN